MHTPFNNEPSNDAGFIPDGKGWMVNPDEGVAVGPTIPIAGFTITPLAEITTNKAGMSGTVLSFDITAAGVRGDNLDAIRDLLTLLRQNLDNPDWEAHR